MTPEPVSKALARYRAQVPVAKRAASMARRVVTEPAYRARVLNALDAHVVARAPEAHADEVAGRERWLEGERVFFIGGCEFTYVKERLETFGATTFHTFDHGRASDPVVESADDASPVWTFEPTAVGVSIVQRASTLFHRLLWQSSDYDADTQAADLAAVLDGLSLALRSIRERTSAPIFVLGHPLADRPGLGVTESVVLGETRGQAELRHLLAVSLYDIARAHDDVHVLDTDVLLGQVGRSQTLREASELLGEHFTPAGVHVIADQFATVLHALSTTSRKVKVAVVDLDNTMWAGVIREVGPEGVKVRAHRARALKVLAQRGILLAVCSKNDPVEEQFLTGLLGQDLVDEFVLVRLSWDPKSDQLRRMAEELSLGLDSFALFDDNPRERAEVEMNTPEVLVLTEEDIVPALGRPEFQIGATLTAETRERSKRYRERRQRQDLEAKTATETGDGREAYLRSLGLAATVRPAGAADIGRVEELLTRTNQLNATVNRSSAPDLADDLDVYVCELSDAFGDFGLIGAAVVRRDGDAAELTEFAFSCRAMGCCVEHMMLRYLSGRLRDDGLATLAIGFTHTARNARMREILDESGFVSRGRDGDHERLERSLAEAPEPVAPWIAVTVG